MADPTTSRLNLPYPTSSDLVSQGPAEFNSLATTIDTLYGLEYQDFLNPGVTGNAAVLNASGPTVSASTGVITVSLNSDTAWVDNSSSVLTRTLLPTGTQLLTPGTLPTSGGYMNVGVYVQSGVWSATGTLITASGSQQSSQANALASPPLQPSASVLLMYCIIQNSAGAYLLSTSVDERVFLSRRQVPGSTNVQPNTTSGLTNTTAALPTHACAVTLVTSTPGIVTLTGLSVVDKTGGSTGLNIYAALAMDGTVLPGSQGSLNSMVGFSGSGYAPTTSLLFATGDPTYGLDCIGISGAGDYAISSLQQVGAPVSVYVATGGTHTFEWMFYCDSGATYSVVSQLLMART